MARTQGKASAHAEDAATLLVEDHRKVRRMFDKFKKLKSGDVEQKEDLVRMACTELRIHAMLEEEIFYPAVREKLDETGLIDEADVEHAVAKQLIGELEKSESPRGRGREGDLSPGEESKSRYASARKGNSATDGCLVRRTILEGQSARRSADPVAWRVAGRCSSSPSSDRVAPGAATLRC